MIRELLYLQLLLVSCGGVLFEGNERNDEGFQQEFDSGLGTCLRSGEEVLPCITSGAVQVLEAASSSRHLQLSEGLTLLQDNTLPYTEPPRLGDPREAKTLLDGLGLYMERRSLQWDLSGLYPGLAMKVGPTSNGMLEFEVDPRKVIDDRALSTGRLLMKRTLLPILLGLKLNVVSLVPLIFAGLIILIKKALFLSKLSFLFSGISLLKSEAHHHKPHLPVLGGGGYGLGGYSEHNIYKDGYLYEGDHRTWNSARRERVPQ